MDQRGWLQRVALALSSQMAGGKPAKFFVNQWREIIERPVIAPGPLNQQSCHIVCCRHVIENTALSLCRILHFFALLQP
jgi:hypothetical protein